MCARKKTGPIAKEFEMIDIATSPTRPSPSDAEPVMPEAYCHMLDNDWVEHDDVSIMLFSFNLHFFWSRMSSYFFDVDSFTVIWTG